MISVQLQGRLGNQMFQYAFAYSTARKLKTSFVVDHSLEPGLIYRYFELSNFSSQIFNIRGFKNIFSYYLRIGYSKIQRLVLGHRRLTYAYDIHSSQVLNSLEDHTLYCGYFQSESYFHEHRDEIRKAFRIKKSIREKFDIAYRQIYNNNKTAVIHIRRSDYKSQGHLNLGSDDISLPMSYYHDLVAKLDDGENFFIFTSDEPDFAEKEFDYVKNKYVSFGDEITDFQHMLNADICVISNSTFSWWSAYLNSKPEKEIYCPAYFLGFHLKKVVPPEIYPPEWKQVEVYP